MQTERVGFRPPLPL